jgi:transposase InsO family protein
MLSYYHLWRTNPTEARRVLINDYQEIIYLQTDWGAEYGGHQTRSLKRYGQELNQLKLKSIPPFTHLHTRKGKPEDNGFVERSHRTDDEEFYRLEKGGFKSLKDFMLKASEWLYYYNYDHSHDGLGGPVLAGLGQGRALLRLLGR